jgi:hypothetical protein
VGVLLWCIEGIHDIVAIIVQLSLGDAKFSEGESGVSKEGISIEALEELGKFGYPVQLVAGV